MSVEVERLRRIAQESINWSKELASYPYSDNFLLRGEDQILVYANDHNDFGEFVEIPVEIIHEFETPEEIYNKERFILGHDVLSEIDSNPDMGPDEQFTDDLIEGRLTRHRGTFVAYQKDVYCGQDPFIDLLTWVASAYYGSSNLTIFKVPAKGRSIQSALRSRRIAPFPESEALDNIIFPSSYKRFS